MVEPDQNAETIVPSGRPVAIGVLSTAQATELAIPLWTAVTKFPFVVW